MGGFPALPSGNNPYVGAANPGNIEGVYNSLQSRLAQAAQHKAAALQKQQEDTAAAVQKEFADQFQLNNAGAIPVNLPRMGYAPTVDAWGPRPTLQREESNPAAPTSGKGQNITTPGGTKYYMPTDLEKGKTFKPSGGLAAALIAGGAWDGSTEMTAAHSHQALQALNEVAKQYAEEPFDIDTSGKFLDGNGNPMAVAIGKHSKKVTPLNMGAGAPSPAQTAAAPMPTVNGSPGGPFAGPSDATQPAPSPQGFAVNGLPGGPFTVQPPTQAPAQPIAAMPAQGKGGMSFKLPEKEKPEKAPRTRVDLTNFNTPVSVNEETGEITAMKLPTGVSRTMSPAQIEAKKDRDARAGQAAADRGQARQFQTEEAQKRVDDKWEADKNKATDELLKGLDGASSPKVKKVLAQHYLDIHREGQKKYERVGSALAGQAWPHNDYADKMTVDDVLRQYDPDSADAPAQAAQPVGRAPSAASPQAEALPVAAQPTAKTASQPTVQSSKYKVGETRTHEGATYRFDGGQWVQQPAPKAAPTKGPKLGDVKTYNGAQYKFDGKQYVYAGAATNATR